VARYRTHPSCVVFTPFVWYVYCATYIIQRMWLDPLHACKARVVKAVGLKGGRCDVCTVEVASALKSIVDAKTRIINLVIHRQEHCFVLGRTADSNANRLASKKSTRRSTQCLHATMKQ
jgi:hypothetical protein